MAEHPRTTAGNGSVSPAIDRKANRKRSELFNVAWKRCESFVRIAQQAWRARTGEQAEMTMPGLLGPAFRERLAAAMRIPVVEALFPQPWTAAARRVLPSPSPQLTATAMWAPIIAWCALETLAESIGAEMPEQIALEVFDRLRLRQPLGESFKALGFDGEAGWRAAARIKVVLLAQSEIARGKKNAQEKATPAFVETDSRTIAQPKPAEELMPVQGAHRAALEPDTAEPIVCGIPRDLWSDPDVRWLTGVHDAGESTYVVCEPYEELLWWLQMPELLSIAGQSSPSKSDVRALSAKVHQASAAADKAGYRLQMMLGLDAGKAQSPASAIEKDAKAGREATEAEESQGEESSPRESLKTQKEVASEPNR
jgi:hypothetical protein